VYRLRFVDASAWGIVEGTRALETAASGRDRAAHSHCASGRGVLSGGVWAPRTVSRRAHLPPSCDAVPGRIGDNNPAARVWPWRWRPAGVAHGSAPSAGDHGDGNRHGAAGFARPRAFRFPRRISKPATSADPAARL